MNSTNLTPEDMENLNLNLILSKPVYDSPKSFLFELLYQKDLGYSLAWKNNNTNKEDLKTFPYIVIPENFIKIVIKLRDNEKLTNDEKLLENWISPLLLIIQNEITDNLSYINPEIRQEIYNILIDLLDSICKIDILEEPNKYIEKPVIYLMETEILEEMETIKDLDNIGLKTTIQSNLKERKAIAKTRRDLGEYLNKRYGIILRYEINTIYILDKNNIGYNQIKPDGIIKLLSKDLGENLVSDKDLLEALSFISERKKLEYNKVKFNNCIYDMKLNEVITPKNPVFTDIESKYNYNPNAESYILKNFLETSLEKETPERTKEYIKGVLQVVGYLFSSGNTQNILTFIVGVGGGGKSVFTNVLTEIFSIDKVADLSLQELDNPHGTSSLIGKHLNIVRDADDRLVEAEDVLKQLSGNDPIQTNPKFKEAYTIAREEVAKTLIIANAIPKFRKTSQSLLSRFLIIEFNKKFRGTNKEDKNLIGKILEDPEELEWLIYHGLKEYKEMVEANQDFILRMNEKETKVLVEKYSKPVNYLVSKLVLKYDPEAFEYGESQVFSTPLNKMCVKLAEKEGIEVKTNKKDLIDPRVLTKAIKEEFELYDVQVNKGEYKPVKADNQKRYYPDLIKDIETWEYLDNN